MQGIIEYTFKKTVSYERNYAVVRFDRNTVIMR